MVSLRRIISEKASRERYNVRQNKSRNNYLISFDVFEFHVKIPAFSGLGLLLLVVYFSVNLVRGYGAERTTAAAAVCD